MTNIMNFILHLVSFLGKTTKNFMLENMRRIKVTQKINQEKKQMEQNRPVKPMFKLERFETNATSTVAKTIKVRYNDNSLYNFY